MTVAKTRIRTIGLSNWLLNFGEDPWSDEYIDSLDEARQSDMRAIDDLIQSVAPQLDRQFERGMIVYGGYRYRRADGSEGYWYPAGISQVGRSRFTALSVMGAGTSAATSPSVRDRCRGPNRPQQRRFAIALTLISR